MSSGISDKWEELANRAGTVRESADKFGRVLVTHYPVGVSREREPVSDMVFVDEAIRQMQIA